VARPENPELLRQSLEQHKQELRVAVQDLRVAARAWSHPRESVREHPVAWLAAAFLFGLWFGQDRKVVIHG
jgi:hypothetical protein